MRFTNWYNPYEDDQSIFIAACNDGSAMIKADWHTELYAVEVCRSVGSKRFSISCCVNLPNTFEAAKSLAEEYIEILCRLDT